MKKTDSMASLAASKWIALLIALVAVFIAVVQLAAGLTVDTTTIYLLLVACVAPLFPTIQKFSFGKDGFSLERQMQQLGAKVEHLAEGTAELSTAITCGVGGKAPASTAGARAGRSVEVRSDDPEAGRWGGSPLSKNRRLSAKVAPSALNENWFKVVATVSSTVASEPLTGHVVFHLHPTFRPSVVRRQVVDGEARLELMAWGAFTIGAQADGGETKLELDLASVGEAPRAFRDR